MGETPHTPRTGRSRWGETPHTPQPGRPRWWRPPIYAKRTGPAGEEASEIPGALVVYEARPHDQVGDVPPEGFAALLPREFELVLGVEPLHARVGRAAEAEVDPEDVVVRPREEVDPDRAAADRRQHRHRQRLDD